MFDSLNLMILQFSTFVKSLHLFFLHHSMKMSLIQTAFVSSQVTGSTTKDTNINTMLTQTMASLNIYIQILWVIIIKENVHFTKHDTTLGI